MRARAERDDLRDQLFLLACAVRDVRRDLEGAPSDRDYAQAMGWLLEACDPLFGAGRDSPERP